MIHIVDYGLGNIQAFMNMYKRLGIKMVRAKTAKDLSDAKKIILPGVGAFDHAMELLDASGMRQTLDKLVTENNVPVLGICVGMQILADSSDEGARAGLGWIKGHVRSFANNSSSTDLPLPHMGWNDVAPVFASPMFRGLEKDALFYFLHSYYFECADPANVAARSDYGFQFDSAVHNSNVFGVQFHPEKSHRWGATLLNNFAEL
jgi:glutamine amidotransferase